MLAYGTYQGARKAYIKDLLTGKAALVKVGDTIGDCKLIAILPEEDSVRLKPSTGAEFMLRRGQAAR